MSPETALMSVILQLYLPNFQVETLEFLKNHAKITSDITLDNVDLKISVKTVKEANAGVQSMLDGKSQITVFFQLLMLFNKPLQPMVL